MKVLTCKNDKQTEKDKPLSWSDIVKKEGVYRLQHQSASPYFITLATADDVIKGVVLFYDGEVLEPAAAHWCGDSRMYVKVHGCEVIFQISHK